MKQKGILQCSALSASRAYCVCIEVNSFVCDYVLMKRKVMERYYESSITFFNFVINSAP